MASQGMMAERAARLMALGFFWDHGSHKQPATWQGEAQLVLLAAYKAAHGDCSVPWGWAEDPPLASGVLRQQQGKRQLDRGEASHQGMMVARAARLTAHSRSSSRSSTAASPARG